MFHLVRFQPLLGVFRVCVLLLLFHRPIEGNAETFQVSKEVCVNGVVDETVKSTCCKAIIDEDLITKSCMISSRLDQKYDNDKDAGIHLSMFVECDYKKRKFIKTDTQLNIGHIKAEAKKQYPDDAQRRNFMVNMYRDCGKQSTIALEKLNSDPRKAEILKEFHKPYFMNVYMCVARYSSSKCPYFRWNVNPDQSCQKWAADCKMLVDSSKKVKKMQKHEESETE